ncbi:nodulation protein E [Albidovulum inexpectatum]|uniref:Nodulation protein E n=1 Tax=Albidovulum inexpectatum TaxID=196587 RepID=A0A2S5JKH7_9RHOB|nr:beta-ketoacyl-[acyl-carrier-protein] synthase family protein [Albidovulum inexpectatum]PPB81878.1 nodulation protein E [Albidovulum inexpectatum]
MRRVAITGAGTINALGRNVPETLAAMADGRSAIGPLELRDLDRLQIRIGAQIRDYRPEDHFGARDLAMLDRFAQFALIAADEAMRSAGLQVDESLVPRAGVILGTAGGGVETSDDSYRAVYQQGRNRAHPFTIPRLMANAAASHVGMRFGLRGPTMTISTACSSANHAMGLAFQMIRCGMADVVLTGGAEAMLTFGGLKAWEGLRVMSPDGCRPFSASRNGMVMGEGAAVFVFEAWEHAVRRRAVILAEIAGFGMTADAADLVMPSQQGAEQAIRAALLDARLAPEAVGYVNAHGTGTSANDRIECAALRAALGNQADSVMVSSTKAMHGHVMGATGAVELLACILALRDGVIAPTVNFDRPDPECDLDVVPNAARQARIDAALSNSFAFGGLNAVLALKRA